jgi:hypothetical protein
MAWESRFNTARWARLACVLGHVNGSDVCFVCGRTDDAGAGQGIYPELVNTVVERGLVGDRSING